MSTIHDQAGDGTLTEASLRNSLARDPSVIDREGGMKNITPLAAACWGGHLDVVKLLLNNGAKPDAYSPKKRTPLYFVTTLTPPANRLAIFHALLKERVDFDLVCDEDGNTPLMNAISQVKDKQLVGALVDEGASQLGENKYKETVATLAKVNGFSRLLRPKEERESSRAKIVDLVVALVLGIIAYTNEGFANTVIRGSVKKLYNISGSIAPEIAKEFPNPTTVEEFQANLDNYVSKGKFRKFFAPNDTFLQELAAKANALRGDSSTDLGKPENLRRLTRLSLYRSVIYCDDSGSMGRDDGSSNPSDNRYQKQKKLVTRIAPIATKIVPDDERGVHLHFINRNGGFFSTEDELESAIDKVKPTSGTPIGTNLYSKILKPLVYDAIQAKTFTRPLLVCIITDGQPHPEPRETMRNAIVECRRTLFKANYDPTSVIFLVNRIGSEDAAADFLEELKSEPTIKDVLHCTSERLDGKDFQEFQNNERKLDDWLLRTLTKPIMGGLGLDAHQDENM